MCTSSRSCSSFRQRTRNLHLTNEATYSLVFIGPIFTKVRFYLLIDFLSLTKGPTWSPTIGYHLGRDLSIIDSID